MPPDCFDEEPGETWWAAGLTARLRHSEERGCAPSLLEQRVPARAPRCAPPLHRARKRQVACATPTAAQCARSLAASGSVRGAHTHTRGP